MPRASRNQSRSDFSVARGECQVLSAHKSTRRTKQLQFFTAAADCYLLRQLTEFSKSSASSASNNIRRHGVCTTLCMLVTEGATTAPNNLVTHIPGTKCNSSATESTPSLAHHTPTAHVTLRCEAAHSFLWIGKRPPFQPRKTLAVAATFDVLPRDSRQSNCR